MNKKLGKFKVWQLVAAGVALGLIVYIYNRNKSESQGPNPEEIVGGTGTGAFGPIDPNSGIPYAFESQGASGEGNEGLNLATFLENVGLLREAFGGEGFGPSGTETVVETTTEGGNGSEAGNKASRHNKTGQHKHTHKPKSTGDAAHAKHTHHSPKHPHQRVGVGQARPVGGRPHRPTHRPSPHHPAPHHRKRRKR